MSKSLFSLEKSTQWLNAPTVDGVLYPKTLFVAMFRQKHNSEDIWVGLLFSFGYSLQKLRLFSKLTTRVYFDRAYTAVH